MHQDSHEDDSAPIMRTIQTIPMMMQPSHNKGIRQPKKGLQGHQPPAAHLFDLVHYHTSSRFSCPILAHPKPERIGLGSHLSSTALTSLLGYTGTRPENKGQT